MSLKKYFHICEINKILCLLKLFIKTHIYHNKTNDKIIIFVEWEVRHVDFWLVFLNILLLNNYTLLLYRLEYKKGW